MAVFDKKVNQIGGFLIGFLVSETWAVILNMVDWGF
jgi:hypothetical protein